MTDSRRAHSHRALKNATRFVLGGMWVYQGVVPKFLAAVPLEHEIVARSGLYLGSPAATMKLIGAVEILLGIWLVSGYRERPACLISSAFLTILSLLVLVEEPSLLVGPFGGIIKNAALFACAYVVWRLGEPEKA